MPLMDRGYNGPDIMPGGIQAIPSSITNVTLKSCKIKAIVVSNPTAGAITITIRHGNTTDPIVFNQSVPANTSIVLPSQGMACDYDGLLFPNGISWTASGAGMYGEIIGTRKL